VLKTIYVKIPTNKIETSLSIPVRVKILPDTAATIPAGIEGRITLYGFPIVI